MAARKHVPPDRPSKRAAALHDQRLEKLSRRLQDGHEAELKRRYNGMGEAEVVLGEQLSNVIRQWVKEWLVDRPRVDQINGRVMGPMDYLKEQTGIHIRRVQGIANGEFKLVSVTQADSILTVIGKQYMLSNGEIRVIPNPNWSLDRWTDYMRERGCI
jgi:hypothetical protein